MAFRRLRPVAVRLTGGQELSFEFVSCPLFSFPRLVGLPGILVVVFSRFTTDCRLADTELLGRELLDFVLLVERLNEVLLCQGHRISRLR